MNIYIDTEFHNYKYEPLFKSMPVNTIDLISIGMIDENGKEFYEISKDFQKHDAWTNDWLRINVLMPIFFDLAYKEFHSTHFKDEWIMDGVIIDRTNFKLLDYSKSLSEFDRLLNKYGKTNEEIADGVKRFIGGNDIKLFGYYSGFDYVVLSQLFGDFDNYPKNMPMYITDLKQMLDEKVEGMYIESNDPTYEYKFLQTFSEKIKMIQDRSDYPHNELEHSSLEDAKWTVNLHRFIEQL